MKSIQVQYAKLRKNRVFTGTHDAFNYALLPLNRLIYCDQTIDVIFIYFLAFLSVNKLPFKFFQKIAFDIL
jgi:hypothetical protein